jgi:hypothetical protein
MSLVKTRSFCVAINMWLMIETDILYYENTVCDQTWLKSRYMLM